MFTYQVVTYLKCLLNLMITPADDLNSFPVEAYKRNSIIDNQLIRNLKMLTLYVTKLQDFCFVRSNKNEEILEFVKPFITNIISSSSISIEREKYIPFLKLVYILFGQDVIIKETVSYDSQEYESDFMLTNQVTSKGIIELIRENDSNFGLASSSLEQDLAKKIDLKKEEEDSRSSTSCSSSSSAVSSEQEEEDKPEKPLKEMNRQRVTVQRVGNEYKVSFDYDPRVVSVMKELHGRKYDPISKTWTIPKENKSILIRKLFQLNKLVNLC